ncbi:Zinc finger, RING-type [Kalmanozyma brasiliensis GHG001]|uniref:Zinc finger, RING-type n=1 Tax=Kalmanozyma brasiliensis (strain GHG001) TaxID=1365824 RepID=UPI002867DE4B|nr:Zinc finger, RING-type [Kalmanozyma brasiliensis GHG001]EST06997.2 Zinc finger, RING-type [Kalmanozyma brasiliensis GHG001]
MENTDSSSPSGDPPRSADDTRQLNEAQSGTPPSSTAHVLTTNPQPSSSNAESSEARSAEAQPSQPGHPSPSQAAPATTLWENFMASFRTVIHGSEPQTQQSRDASTSSAASASNAQPQESTATQPTPAPSRTESSSAGAGAEPSASSQQTTTTEFDTNSSRLPRPPVFFRLPFAGADGNPALLAFHPQPLPPRDSGAPSAAQPASTNQNGSQNSASQSRPDAQPQVQGNAANTAATDPHSHPHPDGHVPIAPLFVPFGASPMPFSFIYDANTQTAWPIAQVTPGSPPGGPSPDAPESQQPRLVAGPPFRIILDIHFTAPPPPEQPDARKAASYVAQLERADAELRARMARLGMGSIGGFGDDQDALLGCGICLDSYASDDRPEWIDGPKSQDEAVVAVPCPGHHTLHAGCLRDWLEKLPPSQWTCPFCRTNLSVSTSTSAKAISSASTQHTTLREEVRARERQVGWRCDAPACLPRYPVTDPTDAGGGHLELPETSEDMTTDLVRLSPCHHAVHLDCLCTAMRVENDLVATSIDALPDEEEGERDTVGKWVTCPACRKECWAELPLRRRPLRAGAAGETEKPSHSAEETSSTDMPEKVDHDSEEDAVVAMLASN